MRNIKIFEMFMRDGLQSLKKVYTLNQKKIFINNLLKTNIQNIEFGSTTSPKLLPQMDNSYELWDHIKSLKVMNDGELTENKFTMLVVDKNNLYKSIKNSINSFGLICSLSDSFAQSNMKMTSMRSFVNILNNIDILFSDKKENYHVRIYISCTFGTYNENDKYDHMDKTFRNNLIVFLRFLKIKAEEYAISSDKLDIVLCDTYGILNDKLLNMVLEDIAEMDIGLMEYIGLHLHTDGEFYHYIDTALKFGINKIDSSILNVGGCPYSGKKNLSNINTLNLVKYLHEKKYDTFIDYEMLKNVENEIKYIMDK